MKISIREALFTGDEVEAWEAPSLDRFEVFDEKGVKNWFKLIEAHPDVFEYETSTRIARKDKALISWVQVYGSARRLYFWHSSHADLGRESELYLYDTITQAIVFDNDKMGLTILEQLFPQIEDLIDNNTRDAVVNIK